MKIEEQLKKIEQKRNRWDIALVITMVIITLAGTIGLPYFSEAATWSEWLVCGLIGFIVFGLVASLAGSHLDSLVRRKWVKSYFIEDCGDVVKLHGSVRADHMVDAFTELLSTRPGLRMVDDAFSLYGCALAAVITTSSDLEIEKFAAKHGNPNHRIS